MAKIGLNLGEKIEIGGKLYRTLHEAIDCKQLLGDLTFVSIDGSDIVYEDVQENGVVKSVNTGEVRGVNVSLRSSTQEGTLSVKIVDMFETEIEELKLGFLDEVELDDVVVTYSAIDNNDVYNVFASKIRKKNAGAPKQDKKQENKQEHHQG